MGRGRNYTEDDNRKLMVLIKDYPDKKASFIAKKVRNHIVPLCWSSLS